MEPKTTRAKFERTPEQRVAAVRFVASLMAEGVAVTTILKREDNPVEVPQHFSTFYDWIRAEDELRVIYEAGLEARAAYWAEQIIEIADTPRMGRKFKHSAKDGRSVETGDMLEHRKLQVDARKWVAARLLPKKYGDRVTEPPPDVGSLAAMLAAWGAAAERETA